MVLPGAAPARTDETAEMPEPEPEPPEITSISQFEFRRFVEPKYPPGLSARLKEGWVEVRFLVNEKGKPEDIVVSGAEPAGVFEQAAVNVIRKWRFEPHVVDGKPRAMQTGVRLRFEK